MFFAMNSLGDRQLRIYALTYLAALVPLLLVAQINEMRAFGDLIGYGALAVVGYVRRLDGTDKAAAFGLRRAPELSQPATANPTNLQTLRT
jgi:hypothetical protein